MKILPLTLALICVSVVVSGCTGSDSGEPNAQSPRTTAPSPQDNATNELPATNVPSPNDQSPSAPSQDATGKLRFTGVYRKHKDGKGEDILFQEGSRVFIRQFKQADLEAASYASDAINSETYKSKTSNYTIDGQNISFSEELPRSFVDGSGKPLVARVKYAGRIDGDTLHLETSNNLSPTKTSGEYKFVSLTK